MKNLYTIDVDELANEIRRVDGAHTLGAGALAEALMPSLALHSAQRLRELRLLVEWAAKEARGGAKVVDGEHKTATLVDISKRMFELLDTIPESPEQVLPQRMKKARGPVTLRRVAKDKLAWLRRVADGNFYRDGDNWFIPENYCNRGGDGLVTPNLRLLLLLHRMGWVADVPYSSTNLNRSYQIGDMSAAELSAAMASSVVTQRYLIVLTDKGRQVLETEHTER